MGLNKRGQKGSGQHRGAGTKGAKLNIVAYDRDISQHLEKQYRATNNFLFNVGSVFLESEEENK